MSITGVRSKIPLTTQPSLHLSLPAPSLPISSVVDSTWSWQSPNTWPKWLVGLLIGVPLIAGGVYWIYRSQEGKFVGSIDSPRKQTLHSGSKFKGAGDAASGVSTAGTSTLPASKEFESATEAITRLKNEGNQLFRAKRYNEAKQIYSQAITIANHNNIKDDLARSLQNRAACNEQLKLYEDVRNDCTTAIETDKRYAKAYARRSRAQQMLNKLTEAAHDMIAASILTNFQNSEYREKSEKLLRELAIKLARVEMEEKRARPLTSRKLSKVFVRQFNHGFSRDPILKAVDKVAADRNGSADLVEDALWAFSRGEYGQVINICSESLLACSTDDRHIMARLLRGTMYFLFGDIASAKTDFEYVIAAPNSSFSEKTNARVKLACLYLQESIDPSEVINRLNDAEAKDPINADIFFHRAQCNMLFGRFDDCLNDLRMCEQLKDDTDATIAFHIAHIEYRLKSTKDPSDNLPLVELENKLTTLNLPEGYVLLGQLFMENNQHDKSHRLLTRAVGQKMDVHNAVVFTQLALLEMLWREDRLAARSSLMKALAIDPYYTQALELLMDLEIQAGNLVQARELYELCVDLAKSEMELVPLIQAYQIGEAGHVVYAQLGIQEDGYSPLPFGMPPDA